MLVARTSRTRLAPRRSQFGKVLLKFLRNGYEKLRLADVAGHSEAPRRASSLVDSQHATIRIRQIRHIRHTQVDRRGLLEIRQHRGHSCSNARRWTLLWVRLSVVHGASCPSRCTHRSYAHINVWCERGMKRLSGSKLCCVGSATSSPSRVMLDQPRTNAATVSRLSREGDIAALVDLLGDETAAGRWSVRAQAAAALGKLRAASAVPQLIRLLAHDDRPEVRTLAAAALGEIGSIEGVEPLLSALHDADAATRLNAAISLGKLRDPRALFPLVELLEEPSAETRMIAAEALGVLFSRGRRGGRGLLDDHAELRDHEPPHRLVAASVDLARLSLQSLMHL